MRYHHISNKHQNELCWRNSLQHFLTSFDTIRSIKRPNSIKLNHSSFRMLVIKSPISPTNRFCIKSTTIWNNYPNELCWGNEWQHFVTTFIRVPSIKRLNSIDFNQSRFRKSWIESAAAAPSADNKSILNEILKPWKQSGTWTLLKKWNPSFWYRIWCNQIKPGAEFDQD